MTVCRVLLLTVCTRGISNNLGATVNINKTFPSKFSLFFLSPQIICCKREVFYKNEMIDVLFIAFLRWHNFPSFLHLFKENWTNGYLLMRKIDIYGVTFHSLGILASDWKEDTPVCRCYLSLQDKLWKFSHFAHDQNVEERKRASSGGEYVIALWTARQLDVTVHRTTACH